MAMKWLIGQSDGPAEIVGIHKMEKAAI